MRTRRAFTALLTSLLVLGSFDAAAAKFADDHVVTGSQPLPATFKVQLPDSNLQQYAVFQISGDVSKKAFKKLRVKAVVNSAPVEPYIRYAAGFEKPKKNEDGGRTVTMVLAINNLNEGDPLAVPPGSICTDNQQQRIECPPGTLDVTISLGKKAKSKDIVLAGAGYEALNLAAVMLADDVTRDEILGADFAWFLDMGFPTPPNKIFDFVEEGSKMNDLDLFHAFPPQPEI